MTAAMPREKLPLMRVTANLLGLRAAGRDKAALGDAEFVAPMRSERVAFGKLDGHLFSKVAVVSPVDIDLRQLLDLGLGRFCEFTGLARKVGLFGVGLRADRDVFACRHGHRPGDEPGEARDQYLGFSRSCRGDADNQARSRHESVIGAQHGRPQPADAMRHMNLGM